MIYSGAPRDTVGYWLKGTALAAHIDRSMAPVTGPIEALKDSGMLLVSNIDPCKQALDFYLHNHAAADIASRYDVLEPLPAKELDILRNYVELGSSIACRLFWYVLLITTREARHNKTPFEKTDKMSAVYGDVTQVYPEVTNEMFTSMFAFTKGAVDSAAIVEKMASTQVTQYPLGPFCKMLSSIYYRCVFNSNYGGKAWGNIADALHSFVSGEWTAEMFADTAFTLAHNTAPIFNKGMLYEYPNAHTLLQILDCQRAGAIPQWLQANKNWMTSQHKIVADTVPHLFAEELDWGKVTALGAVGSYQHLIKAKPPAGCIDKKIQIDHATELYVLDYQRAA